MDLNAPIVATWMIRGILDATILYFLTYCVVGTLSDGIFIFGTTAYSCLVLGMLYRAASSTFTWNVVVAFFWVGSAILYGGIFMPIYSSWYEYAPNFYGVASHMVAGDDGQGGLFWLVMLLVPAVVVLLDIVVKMGRSMLAPSAIDHAMEIDRGITYDVQETIRVFEGDTDTVSRIIDKRGQFADDGLYKWWRAFNARLPKVKFDRKRLRFLNRSLDARSKKEMGIIDTEVEKSRTSFAYDHISRELGIGGGAAVDGSRDGFRFSEESSLTRLAASSQV